MNATIPAQYHDLLEGAVTVSFVTVLPDGTPQVTPVWCDFDGTHVLINTAEGRRKDKNVRANPNVAVLAIDPQNPYRWVEVRGVVEEITREGAVDLIDKLAKVYTGNERYYGGVTPAEVAEKEVRVTLKIKPTKVNAAG